MGSPSRSMVETLWPLPMLLLMPQETPCLCSILVILLMTVTLWGKLQSSF
jgi:hypothetical protein